MKASEMTNVQIADYILSLQSDVDGFPFNSNEIIREAAKRLLTDGDDDISKDAEIAELRRRLNIAEDALEKCVNYNNAWELESAEENAKNALVAIRGEGEEDDK